MRYAHPAPEQIPSRRRCKVLHSPRTPARCKLTRDHDGDCLFGWYPDPIPYGWQGQVTNLDVPLPTVVTELSAAQGAPVDFDG